IGNPSLNHRYRKGFYSLFKTLQQNQKSDLIETDSEDDKDATTGEEIVAYWNWERKNYFIKK
ncbi:replication protein, partial [Aerococcus viridans]